MTLQESSIYHSTSNPISSLRTIAINVLTRVAYGQHTPFSPGSLYRESTNELSYVDAISMVVDSLLVATFVPSRILRLSFMPRLSKRLGKALEQLPRLTLNMLDQERKRSSSAHPGHARHNVMTTLVRLSDQAKEHDRLGASIEKSTVTTVRKQYLTEEEIAGNLFVLTAAGYDTTSNTMSYAVLLLAAFPEWQSWIQAEIDDVLRSRDDCDQEQDYAAIFPKLSRCLAVMVSSIPPSLSLIPSD
jgi:hypothetical protein